MSQGAVRFRKPKTIPANQTHAEGSPAGVAPREGAAPTLPAVIRDTAEQVCLVVRSRAREGCALGLTRMEALALVDDMRRWAATMGQGGAAA